MGASRDEPAGTECADRRSGSARPRVAIRTYFAGDPANASDPILALVPAERRDTLLTKPDPKDPNLYRFDIRVHGGADETAFCDT